MESLQNLKRRQKGVQNIGKITKAMELVAATKMRKSQEIALNSRPYALAALELLARLSKIEHKDLPEILGAREVKKRCIVLVTSDKGLAGAFNSAVVRRFEKFIKEKRIDIQNENYSFIGVGEKAIRHLSKRTGFKVKKFAPTPKRESSMVRDEGANSRLVWGFVRFGDYTTIPEIKPLSDYLTEGYRTKKWDEVIVFSTHFRSALKQDVLERKILPIDFETLKATAKEIIPQSGRFAEAMKENNMSFFQGEQNGEYLFEPSPGELLRALVPHLVEMQIYHLVLEANASEHAARRVAMKNASDNALNLSQELTVEYNKSRQATITRELTEITAGAEALQ